MLFANLFTFVSLSNVFYIWSESEKVAQSYLTVCNPMDCIVHGIFCGLEWVAFPFRGSSQPGIKLRSPTLQVNSLPAEPPGKHILYTHFRKKLGNCYDDLNCKRVKISVHFSSFQLLSHVWLFATPWITARQASLSITNSRSLHKLMSIELAMPSSHLILCHPLLLLLPIPPSIRVFSSESTLRMRWPKYWSFSFSISPSNTQDWSPLGWTGWISLQSKGLSRVFSNTIVQKHQFFSVQLSS